MKDLKNEVLYYISQNFSNVTDAASLDQAVLKTKISLSRVKVDGSDKRVTDLLLKAATEYYRPMETMSEHFILKTIEDKFGPPLNSEITLLRAFFAIAMSEVMNYKLDTEKIRLASRAGSRAPLGSIYHNMEEEVPNYETADDGIHAMIAHCITSASIVYDVPLSEFSELLSKYGLTIKEN